MIVPCHAASSRPPLRISAPERNGASLKVSPTGSWEEQLDEAAQTSSRQANSTLQIAPQRLASTSGKQLVCAYRLPKPLQLFSLMACACRIEVGHPAV